MVQSFYPEHVRVKRGRAAQLTTWLLTAGERNNELAINELDNTAPRVRLSDLDP